VSVLVGGAIGDCTVDEMVVTAPGNRGSPPICGYNNGQHSKYGALLESIRLGWKGLGGTNTLAY